MRRISCDEDDDDGMVTGVQGRMEDMDILRETTVHHVLVES